MFAQAARNAIEHARPLPVFGYQSLHEPEDHLDETTSPQEDQPQHDEDGSGSSPIHKPSFGPDLVTADFAELCEKISNDVQLSLDEALRSVGTGVAERAGTEVEVNVSQDIALTSDAFDDGEDALLLLVAAEAAGNIVKHAEATRVVIDLTIDDGSAVLRVVDDGVGFDAANQLASLDADEGLLSNQEGLGFVMDQIIDSDGTFQIGSTPGEGTTIVARLPISHG